MRFQLPQNTIFYQLEKAIKQYRKMAQDRINATGHRVSLNQLILLLQLLERPQSTQVELAESVFKDFASVARMVDLLVKKGYLHRSENPHDRRKKDLVPTPACKKMVAELVPVIQEYRAAALHDFGATDLEQLSSLLQQLTANCQPAVP
ncbi:MAG: MarR family transcriptional regulator, partial [Bacteroidota bacterium]